MSVIFNELAEIYEASTIGRKPDLPPLSLAYSDFARWQQEHLTEETLAADFAYWQANLQGSPELLELPTNRRRPPIQNHRARAARHFHQC